MATISEASPSMAERAHGSGGMKELGLMMSTAFPSLNEAKDPPRSKPWWWPQLALGLTEEDAMCSFVPKGLSIELKFTDICLFCKFSCGSVSCYS